MEKRQSSREQVYRQMLEMVAEGIFDEEQVKHLLEFEDQVLNVKQKRYGDKDSS